MPRVSPMFTLIIDEILSYIKDIIIVLDTEGKIVMLNKQLLKTLGFYNDELMGKTITKIVHNKSIIDIFKHRGFIYKSLHFSKVNFIAKSGLIVPISLSIIPIVDPSTKALSKILLVGQDISLTKKLRQEIIKHKETALKLKSAKEKIEKMNMELAEKNVLLIENNCILRDRSIRDGLTNLYNHRYIIEALEREIKRAKRYHTNLSIIMIDVDLFKRINDNFGHLTGDMTLASLSQIILKNIRDIDIAGRYGGEEFLVIFPNTDKIEATKAAERIRKCIEHHTFSERKFNITVSIGVKQYSGQSPCELIKEADKLMYKAKLNGRNRVESED